MNAHRLEQLLAGLAQVRLAVAGDFFLDQYLVLDRRLSETSLETGLEAYQVMDTRLYPGAAGTVTANLRALGVQVAALGFHGDDGNGYELRRRLAASQVDVRSLLEVPGLATPTYTKPLMREPDGSEHELNRMDVKPRRPLAPALEDRLMQEAALRLAQADGLLVIDQARQPDCGVITARLRAELRRLAQAQPTKLVLIDSREFLEQFDFGILKANLGEALRASGLASRPGESPDATASRCARHFVAHTGQPAIITLGSSGMYALPEAAHPGWLIPATPVDGPIDIVGAGDAVDAALSASLCAGATLEEAGQLASLVASIVIQQIGVTGTATPEQIIRQFHRHGSPSGLLASKPGSSGQTETLDAT